VTEWQLKSKESKEGVVCLFYLLGGKNFFGEIFGDFLGKQRGN
jgi:hypothetical protein